LETIRDVIRFARQRTLRLTLITAERVNEWNVACESLEESLSDQYRLDYLARSEIEALVLLLAKHHALGPNLSDKTFEQQVHEFEKKAGRQLLVALHEATQGRPFEEILLDEYENIIPPEAQRLYLTVCVLNRLKVPVRAGLISRIHELPFETFRERLFKPLEHVVQIVTLPWGDFAYEARHSEIAQIVFEQVLTDSTERFNEYIRVVRALNPAYSVDNEALRGMLRAKPVHDLFPNYEDAKAIYDSATEMIGDDAHLLQQRANYERIRPNGNFSFAQTLLDKARQMEPHDFTIVHTLAEVLRARAEGSQKKLERARFRGEAKALLRGIPLETPSARYASVTSLKLWVDEVRDLLIDPSSTDREIDETVRGAERAFESARQTYPGDKFVLAADSELAKLLNDSERSYEALKKARASNPRDPFLASRLAGMSIERNDPDTAQKYIEEALESNSGDRRLNFLLAELLRTKKETSAEDLAYYYRKSFVKWDKNYQSHFWYARFAFESNDAVKVQESKEIFSRLREIPISYEDRVRVRDAIGGLSEPNEFSGTINRVEASHGFIIVDGRGDRVFFHETDMVEVIWTNLRFGMRVRFAIGFSFRGPKALMVRLEGRHL
jgi:tetratricopeptide (TPR) repeat protein